MILDLPRFIAAEQPYWQELEHMLGRGKLTFDEVLRLHYLYERSSSDLARIMTFSAETGSQKYLENLVARAYAEIHGSSRTTRLHPWRWFTATFPQTFRRHLAAFWLATAITIAGALAGAILLIADPDSKHVLMPFPALMQDPAARVAEDEAGGAGALEGHRASFASSLMTNNIRVAVTTLAFGMTWGIGTVVALIYNGVMLGAVAADYVRAGQTAFLLGWLLPHGSIEIPCILFGGQAGLVLARALIGWGDATRLRDRMRAVTPGVLTLGGGAAVLLVWAGCVESFISQYHRPFVPYEIKIALGIAEGAALAVFLSRGGREA